MQDSGHAFPSLETCFRHVILRYLILANGGGSPRPRLWATPRVGGDPGSDRRWAVAICPGGPPGLPDKLLYSSEIGNYGPQGPNTQPHRKQGPPQPATPRNNKTTFDHSPLHLSSRQVYLSTASSPPHQALPQVYQNCRPTTDQCLRVKLSLGTTEPPPAESPVIRQVERLFPTRPHQSQCKFCGFLDQHGLHFQPHSVMIILSPSPFWLHVHVEHMRCDDKPTADENHMFCLSSEKNMCIKQMCSNSSRHASRKHKRRAETLPCKKTQV